MDNKYNIKWKTFADHLIGAFNGLGTEGHFADVTLVSDDQIQTPAHKVVLSACSPVLKTLLVNNPHSHPLLYLRGIKQTELQAILKFMYFGEALISENRINDFVGVAKDLEIKEISEEQEENYIHEEDNPPENDETNIQLDPEIKSENIEAIVVELRQSAVDNTNGRFCCDECEATFTFAHGLSRHKKSKHEGEVVETDTYSCGDCESVFSCTGNLNRHKQSKHAGK